MLHRKSFVKKNKQGKLQKVVREHYLRDDIYCGAPFCSVCDVSGARLSSNPSTIVVVDTNIDAPAIRVAAQWYQNHLGTAVQMMEDTEDLRPSKRKTIYPEFLMQHKPMSEITAGEAYVGSESIGDEIIVYGRTNMNRAFDGDMVIW